MKLIISILIYFINIIESLPLLHKSLITLRVLNDEKSIKYKQIIIDIGTGRIQTMKEITNKISSIYYIDNNNQNIII
jgi:hypothetical protein